METNLILHQFLQLEERVNNVSYTQVIPISSYRKASGGFPKWSGVANVKPGVVGVHCMFFVLNN